MRRSFSWRARPTLEPLECRTAPTVTPVGSEFLVNTTTTSDQQAPAIAMDDVGEFVIVWQSYNQDNLFDIYAQRYNASGLAQGNEFSVNTYTTGDQTEPAVAMDADGDFVVVWRSAGQEGEGDPGGIYGQRYNASGTALGSEFHVNSYTADYQIRPSVARDFDGDFVVVWQSSPPDGFPELGQDGDYSGIYGQRYNASGTAQGSEFLVNGVTINDQRNPDVAMDNLGNFVVVYEQYFVGEDESDSGIAARLYDNTGQPTSGEIHVSVFILHTTSTGETPAVGMDADGDFVVAWTWATGPFIGGPEGIVNDIYARTYNAAGTPQTNPFEVAYHSVINYSQPDVAVDDLGDFVVTWQSDQDQDGNGNGVYARFYENGIAGTAFRVNTYTTGDQHLPAVAMDVDGDFVIAWESTPISTVGQDGDGSGVYAQRYDFTPTGSSPGSNRAAPLDWGARAEASSMTFYLGAALPDLVLGEVEFLPWSV